VLASCSSRAPAGPSPAARTVTDTALIAEREHSSAAGARRYRLFVPAATPARAPLVVWLHGCTQDAAELAAASRMDELAAAEKVVVVYPEQPASANPVKCWNWFAPEHQARGSGEPAILAALTREVAAELDADPARIHIGGISAGGAMAVVAAIAYPDLFASAASHAGIGWRMASDVASGLAVMKTGGAAADSLGVLAHASMGAEARAIPLFVVHGMSDRVATPVASRNLVAQFAALAREAGTPLRVDSVQGVAGGYSFQRLRHLDAGGNPVIDAWFVDSLGHALSGGAPGTRWVDARGPDATREMLRFFLAHPRTGR
jgi:poly(hydroxyalkanoate) depolymerase family esterase